MIGVIFPSVVSSIPGSIRIESGAFPGGAVIIVFVVLNFRDQGAAAEVCCGAKEAK